MRTFTTLDELFEAIGRHQLTAQEVINRRTHLEAEGWAEIELTDELNESFINSVSELLGGQYRTQANICRMLRNSRPQHWGLSRILLSKYGDSPAKFSYCAGQDYPAELAHIRKFLNR